MATSLTLTIATLAAGTLAGAATGDLTFKGCITGETESGPAGTGACAAIPDDTPGGDNSGLGRLQSVALSSDRKSLYAASDDGAAIARFKRDRDNGKLTYKGCITGDTASGPAGSGACTAIPAASAGGTNSGLDDPDAVVLSSDGKSLYAALDSDAAVARFKRNRQTGKLTYKGCVTGDEDAGPMGSGACAAIPDATPGGADSGLDGLEAAAVSEDGRSLYTAAEEDDAVARFKRDRRTGKLTYKGCITGETESGPAGTGACAAIPDATPGADNSGLERALSVALSGDGRWLYAAAVADDAVARFRRDRDNGKLTYRGCITGDAGAGPAGTGACRSIPDPGPAGGITGLDAPDTVALSGDGKSLYVTASGDSAVVRFKRDRDNGKLTFKNCITGDEDVGPAGEGVCAAIPDASPGGNNSGLDDLDAMALSGDGRSLYAVSEDGAGVAHFRRDPDNGKLTYKGCVTGDEDTGPSGSGACAAAPTATPGGAQSGFDDPESLALTGKSLYLVSEDDAAVIRFKRDR